MAHFSVNPSEARLARRRLPHICVACSALWALKSWSAPSNTAPCFKCRFPAEKDYFSLLKVRESLQEKQNFQISITFFLVFLPFFHLILFFVFCRSHIFRKKYFHTLYVFICICICMNYAHSFFKRLFISLRQNLESKFQMDRIEAQFLLSHFSDPHIRNLLSMLLLVQLVASNTSLNFILKPLH